MRLNLKAKVLSLAVLPVLVFALVISASTIIMLREQGKREVEEVFYLRPRQATKVACSDCNS